MDVLPPTLLLLHLFNRPLTLPPFPSPLAGAGRGDKGELVCFAETLGHRGFILIQSINQFLC